MRISILLTSSISVVFTQLLLYFVTYLFFALFFFNFYFFPVQILCWFSLSKISSLYHEIVFANIKNLKLKFFDTDSDKNNNIVNSFAAIASTLTLAVVIVAMVAVVLVILSMHVLLPACRCWCTLATLVKFEASAACSIFSLLKCNPVENAVMRKANQWVSKVKTEETFYGKYKRKLLYHINILHPCFPIFFRIFLETFFSLWIFFLSTNCFLCNFSK